MASKKRNALAELANELSWIETILGDKGYGPYCADANKAKRIIAELAKVQDEEAALFAMEYLNPDEARRIVHQRQGNCILKCRAIAEEGANNG